MCELNVKIQRYNFRFKGINCSVWIKALSGESYSVLVRSEKPLSDADKKALKNYLIEEGYFEDINFDVD